MLYITRLRHMASDVYKTVHGLSPKYIQDLLTTFKIVTYNLGNDMAIEQPGYNIVTYGLHSFSYKGIKIWNDLTNDIKSAITLNEFKRLIEMRNGLKYYCLMCTTLL